MSEDVPTSTPADEEDPFRPAPLTDEQARQVLSGVHVQFDRFERGELSFAGITPTGYLIRQRIYTLTCPPFVACQHLPLLPGAWRTEILSGNVVFWCRKASDA